MLFFNRRIELCNLKEKRIISIIDEIFKGEILLLEYLPAINALALIVEYRRL